MAGLILGLLGQVFRVVIGIKKQYDDTEMPLKIFFNKTRLIISLITGGLAGLLAGLFLNGSDINSSAFIIAIIAAGYAGSDFIDGFLRANAPKYTEEELNKVTEQKSKTQEDAITKLGDLNNLLSKQIITQKEYDTLRMEYLGILNPSIE